MEGIYYFSTCFITHDNDIKGKLYINDDLYIDFNCQVVSKSGKTKNITDRSFDCLCTTLLAHPGVALFSEFGHVSQTDVNKAAYDLRKIDDRLECLMHSVRGKGYECVFSNNFRIYKVDKNFHCDYTKSDEIAKSLMEYCKDANFIKSISANITLKNDKPSRGEKKLIEGFLIKFYNKLKAVELGTDKREHGDTFEDFLIRFLYANNPNITLTPEVIENYRYLDSFEPVLLNDTDGAFNEFTDHASDIIEYYTNILFDNYELDIGYNANIMLTVITKSFKASYIDEESLKKLHKNRNYNDISVEGTKRLYAYLNDKIKKNRRESLTRNEFANIIYSVMFFISHGYICKRFSEVINGISADREEFNREVLSKYGCTGNPGIYAIYRLANRKKPNSIAVFEAAELEYYGRGVSSKPNYEKAFALYKKGCYDLENFNPMTAWSYAYMLYNYDKKDLEGVVVKKLESLSIQDRKIKAIKPALMAFECGCPAAANLLGQIVDDIDIPEKYKTNLKRTSVEYYEIASSEGYVFSKNNLAKYWEAKAKEALKQSEKDECLKKVCFYLKESADLCEPYACNKYAATYLINEPTGLNEAFGYFMTAYNLGTGTTKEWAAANLIQYYIRPCKDVDTILINDLLFKYGIHDIKTFYNELIDICNNSTNEEIKTIADNCIEGFVN